MGLSSLVYPGANHTRFEHALGSMHVMQKAIDVLILKGIKINPKEREAMQIAALLHDIGHGPFSHATEKTLLKGIHHETISLKIIRLLNKSFDGKLDLAEQIFIGNHPRKFMHELISGQIDVDRLDYLKRDSFYTGVTEGNINTDRIISTMNVREENLVFETKGIYSLEKFLLARRLMYWQVYLHKTSLAAEMILLKIIQRFQSLTKQQKGKLNKNNMLFPFLKMNPSETIKDKVLIHYLSMDDSDIIQLLKSLENHNDSVLSLLSRQLLNRNLPKIRIRENAYTNEELNKMKCRLKGDEYDISDYFVFNGSISNQTYISDESQILILDKKNHVYPIADAITYLDFKQFSTPIIKFYLCYPKQYSSL
jgi:HD superfamily phosphohydrolase